jgi:uroporphyrinogen-III decarboxylase
MNHLITILEYMLLTGADAFELDYKTNAQKVREIICSKACFIGNIDPSGVLTLGSTELVKQKTIDRVVNY